jgi:D-xylose transport system permease protein
LSTAAPAEVQAAATESDSLAAILRGRWEALKGGDVGSLPVIVGIVCITLFFYLKQSIFIEPGNFTNLIGQMAGVTVIQLAA